MPTYQYACTDPECAQRFELVQAFTDPAASECPTCGGPVRKVFSAVGVVFKGSGFYRNDSRKDTRPEGSSDKGGRKDGESGGSDSGTAAKKDGASASGATGGEKSSTSANSSGSSSSDSSSKSSSTSTPSKSSSGKAATPA